MTSLILLSVALVRKDVAKTELSRWKKAKDFTVEGNKNWRDSSGV